MDKENQMKTLWLFIEKSVFYQIFREIICIFPILGVKKSAYTEKISGRSVKKKIRKEYEEEKGADAAKSSNFHQILKSFSNSTSTLKC